MVLLIYQGAFDEVTVVGVRFANEGSPAEVPDDVGEGLVARGDFRRASAARRPKVADVLAEVGDDPAAAAAATAAERASTRPRRSLLEQLDAIAAQLEPEDAAAGGELNDEPPADAPAEE